MTLAEIRTSVRNLLKEQQTDTGTLLPSGDVLLDFYINFAVEFVTLDLADSCPEDYLDYEDISLVADQSEYTTTAEWLQAWAMLKNVSDESPQPIPYLKAWNRPYVHHVGETHEDPNCWTLKGQTIIFIPTPSQNKTDYARFWYIGNEAASMVAGGPALIPRLAQRLIPIMAAMLICLMNDRSYAPFANFYVKMFDKVSEVMGYRVQQGPRFLGESVIDAQVTTTLDPALHDLGSPF